MHVQTVCTRPFPPPRQKLGLGMRLGQNDGMSESIRYACVASDLMVSAR